VSFLALALLLISQAEAWEALSPREVSLDYTHFGHKGRDPLVTNNGIPHRELGQAVGLRLGIDVLGPLYWRNWVHGRTDRQTFGQASQFRSVGWQFELGVHVTRHLDVFYHHHSQHVLDTTYLPGFPVEDGMGIRLNIIKQGKDARVFE